jgi:hypothetical protein
MTMARVNSVPPGIAPRVACVCGLDARVATRHDRTRHETVVEITCDHGGPARSSTPTWAEVEKYPDRVVANHAVAGSPIVPLGGAMLGAGRTWTPSPSASPFAGVLRSTAPSVGRGRDTCATCGRERGNHNVRHPFKEMLDGPVKNTTPRFPMRRPFGQMEVGDVVSGPLNRTNGALFLKPTELAVVLTLADRGGDMYKATFRRIHDGVYVAIDAHRNVPMRIVADVEMTNGDPDRWVSVTDDIDAERSAPLPSYESLSDAFKRAQARISATGLPATLVGGMPVARGPADVAKIRAAIAELTRQPDRSVILDSVSPSYVNPGDVVVIDGCSDRAMVIESRLHDMTATVRWLTGPHTSGLTVMPMSALVRVTASPV